MAFPAGAWSVGSPFASALPHRKWQGSPADGSICVKTKGMPKQDKNLPPAEPFSAPARMRTLLLRGKFPLLLGCIGSKIGYGIGAPNRYVGYGTPIVSDDAARKISLGMNRGAALRKIGSSRDWDMREE